MIHDPKSRCAARTQNVETFEVITPDEVRARLAADQKAEAADGFAKYRYCAQCLVTPVRTEPDMVKLPGAAQPNATPAKTEPVPASGEVTEQQLKDAVAARATGTRSGAKSRAHTGTAASVKPGPARKTPARAPRTRTRKAVAKPE